MTENPVSQPSSTTACASKWRFGASLAVIAAAAGLGSFAALQQNISQAKTAPAAVQVQPVAAAPALNNSQSAPVPVRGLPDFADLVQSVGPAVVYIETSVKAPTRRAQGGFSFGGGKDPMMDEFFRRFFGDGFAMPAPGDEGSADAQPNVPAPRGGSGGAGRLVPRGSGSGFIVSSDGIVITNAHVVDGADEVTVKLTDKREFKAKVLGKDDRTDIAVLKIDAKGLPALRMGDVNSLRVGQWVIAIGAPFGLENSVTAGIVSAKQRDTGQYVRFIQTDVAINPGNSGGPLINMQGEVVGVNSQILSGSGGYMGVSLSIPINEAMKVANQIRTTGAVQRGYLGINIGDVDDAAAQALKLGRDEGAAVTRVMPQSPADKAGLQAGDIVLQCNGEKIEGSRDLQRRVGDTQPGQTLHLTVLRGGKTVALSVTTGSEKEMEKLSRADHGGSADVSRLGLKLSAVDASTRQNLGIRGGVKVDAVAGAAARAGLQPGDVIVELANTPVQDLEQFKSLVGTLPKQGVVSILYRRGEWTMRSGLRLDS